MSAVFYFFFFFFNDTATTEIYTLSLHDALPIFALCRLHWRICRHTVFLRSRRSEEHTSELQSRQYLVCRLLLEKKKKNMIIFLFVKKKKIKQIKKLINKQH